MEYVDTAKAFALSVWGTAVSYLPTSFCSAADTYNIFVKDLTSHDIAALTADTIVGNVAAVTMLISGGAIFMAPAIFGRGWVSYALVIIAFLVGAIISGMLLQEQGADLFEQAADLVSLPAGEARCGTIFGLQVLSAVLLALFVNKVEPLTHFCLGAAGFGFASYIGVGLLVPALLKSGVLPPVATLYLSSVGETEYYVVAGVFALIGGLLFFKFADALIDGLIGFIGAVLISQGTLNLLLDEVLDAATVSQLSIGEFYMAYMLGLIVLLEVLRFLLVGAREGDWSAKVDRSPGQSLISRAARVSPSKAPQRPAAKATPAKGGRGAARGGKGMY